MFCPNCGTENEEAATTCKKCGFNLKGAAAPKFKGTMLMMNTGGAPRPGPAGTAGPVPGPRPQLKGTMLGVAPPPMGAQQVPAPPVTAP
ncbi:MAG TPA: zinc ribbon domain-containing protein, partial [Polyangiaceae bacterium]